MAAREAKAGSEARGGRHEHHAAIAGRDRTVPHEINGVAHVRSEVESPESTTPEIENTHVRATCIFPAPGREDDEPILCDGFATILEPYPLHIVTNWDDRERKALRIEYANEVRDVWREDNEPIVCCQCAKELLRSTKNDIDGGKCTRHWIVGANIIPIMWCKNDEAVRCRRCATVPFDALKTPTPHAFFGAKTTRPPTVAAAPQNLSLTVTLAVFPMWTAVKLRFAGSNTPTFILSLGAMMTCPLLAVAAPLNLPDPVKPVGTFDKVLRTGSKIPTASSISGTKTTSPSFVRVPPAYLQLEEVAMPRNSRSEYQTGGGGGEGGTGGISGGRRGESGGGGARGGGGMTVKTPIFAVMLYGEKTT
eukprot:6294901-Prymnesium_polylepis.1